MIFYLPLTLVLVVVGFLAQEFVPAEMYGGEFLLLPTLFFCLAVNVPYVWVLLLSCVTGLLWDLRYLEIIPREFHSDLFFGSGVILFALCGSIMYGVRPQARSGHWFAPLLMVSICLLVWQLLGYLFLTFLRGGFDFPASLFTFMIRTALVSTAVAPFCYALIRLLMRWCRYDERDNHGDVIVRRLV